MKTNMFEWLDIQIESSEKKAMPILSFPGIQLLNITVHDLVSSGEWQAKCMKAIADRYPAAASVSIMDLSIEAEAFGANVSFSDDEVPTVIGRLVDTYDDAVSLKIPSVGFKRTKEALGAMEKSLDIINDRPILAGAIGPFSLAGRLMGLTEIMVKSMVEPETAHEVIKKATSFLIDYIIEYKKIGANGIIMAEPAAGLLSPDLCGKFSSAYVKEIIEAVQDENFLVVYHNCGNTVSLVDAITATGAKAIHLGNAIRIAEVIDKYPSNRLLMGNVSPAGEFRNGTVKSVFKATNDLLIELSGRKNWVISSGCDIPPMSPLENIDTFFETVANYYKKMS